jgi:hypothetical protein
MPNGCAITPLPFPSELSPEPSPKDAPASAEDQIGDVLVQLTNLSMQAFWETQEGGKLLPTTRAAGGDLVAKLYWIQSTLGEADFGSAVRRIARLRLSHDAKLSQRVIDEISDTWLGVVNKVAATMRAGMH